MITVAAKLLKKGMILALPFRNVTTTSISSGKTATILDDPEVGSKYVRIRTEFGKALFFLEQEVELEEPYTCQLRIMEPGEMIFGPGKECGKKATHTGYVYARDPGQTECGYFCEEHAAEIMDNEYTPWDIHEGIEE